MPTAWESLTCRPPPPFIRSPGPPFSPAVRAIEEREVLAGSKGGSNPEACSANPSREGFTTKCLPTAPLGFGSKSGVNQVTVTAASCHGAFGVQCAHPTPSQTSRPARAVRPGAPLVAVRQRLLKLPAGPPRQAWDGGETPPRHSPPNQKRKEVPSWAWDSVPAGRTWAVASIRLTWFLSRLLANYSGGWEGGAAVAARRGCWP